MIHIPRVDAKITIDFMKEFMSNFGTIESVVRTENGHVDEVQYHVVFRYWNELGITKVHHALMEKGMVRLAYENEGHLRPSCFLCYMV
jgi:hypothetical protein